MIDIERVKVLANMYKKEKITDYVLERELSQYFGDNVRICIEKEVNGNNNTYGFFAVPEYLVEGFKVVYIIDSKLLKSILSEEEFAIICERLRKKTESILRKFYAFKKESLEREISLTYAIGFLLDLYKSYRADLDLKGIEYLPDEEDLMKYTDRFMLETANKEDIETIKVKGLISNRIIEEAKKYSNNRTNILKISIKDEVEMEKPTFCMGTQEIRKHCTSTFGTRDHKEIPYDYLPKTNQ